MRHSVLIWESYEHAGREDEMYADVTSNLLLDQNIMKYAHKL